MRWLCLILCLAACDPHPKVQAAFLTHNWQLDTLNGLPFNARVTMDVRPTGLVLGATPCNRFSGTLTRFPSGWEFGPIRLRNTPCLQSNAEAAFIQAIAQVTRSQVQGIRLILTGPVIRMEFARIGPAKFTHP
jgi:heat shock protein HslJ